MSPEACLALLGLNPGASAAQVRRAYRRLALRCHPDRNAGDPAAHRRFVHISRAYRLLMICLSSADRGNWGVCAACGGLARLVAQTDGSRCCDVCTLQWSRRLLPHPFVRMVRFHSVMLLLAASAMMLVRAARTGELAWHGGAMMSAVAGSIWLAFWTVWVTHTYDPRMPTGSPARRSPRAAICADHDRTGAGAQRPADAQPSERRAAIWRGR